ncbi:MAG: acyl-CoA dehydratase activase-related protein [Clostridia bacterium]|jgi:predicted nucleotide-binding protein (sugar kinase/HSP70/actin superfamily)|nr:acyl-CoA dehydratase activase-related protein [Clostridia bacterium]
MMRIGIPRALFYYYYFPLWHAFFTALGAKVEVSPPTNKAILDQGVRGAVDEACLPIKVYYGHVLALRNKADLLFVPRLVSVEPKAYICPKFMGLPDMLRAGLRDLPRFIDTNVNLRQGTEKVLEVALEMGRLLTRNKRQILAAWEKAQAVYQHYVALLESGLRPGPAIERLTGVPEGRRRRGEGEGPGRWKVGLVGHGYNLYDEYISMDLIGRLGRLGVEVVTPDQIPGAVIETEAARLPKRLFWTLGKRLVGSTLHFLQRPDIDGIIHVSSFGCGPDSLVGDLVERFSQRTRKLPFLYLTLDEQTGEAGLQTRVEAFTDMLAWRAAQ